MPQEMWMADARVYSKVKVEKASAKVPHSVKMSPEYEMDRYICSTCYNSYLSKRKMPRYSHCLEPKLEYSSTHM